MGKVWVSRSGSGLVEPFDPPELTMNEAIERGWQRRDDGRMLEPKPAEFLPTIASPWHRNLRWMDLPSGPTWLWS